MVKLIVEEPETHALRRHLRATDSLVTSRIAVVEVLRAVRLSDSSTAASANAERLLSSCLLVAVSDEVLRAAAGLASATLRALDSIHLASALRVAPRELVAYDRRLTVAAAAHGLAVSAPGS